LLLLSSALGMHDGVDRKQDMVSDRLCCPKVVEI
jgi:hypothetical protein